MGIVAYSKRLHGIRSDNDLSPADQWTKRSPLTMRQ